MIDFNKACRYRWSNARCGGASMILEKIEDLGNDRPEGPLSSRPYRFLIVSQDE
jgi:hypothetical protein